MWQLPFELKLLCGVDVLVILTIQWCVSLITYTATGVCALVLGRFSGQHGDLGAGLLDELLQVDLPQLLGQQLQLVLHVLQWNTETLTH